MEEDSSEACQCGSFMIVARSPFSDDKFLQCQNPECGDTKPIGVPLEYENVTSIDCGDAYDGGSKFVHEGGSGAKPQGLLYNRASISQGRKNGAALIPLLCLQFNAKPPEEDAMQDMFHRLTKSWRNLPTVAAAVFLVVYRRKHPISLKQVLPHINPAVSFTEFGRAVKRVYKHEEKTTVVQPEKFNESTTVTTQYDEQPRSTSAIHDISKPAFTYLRNLKVQDPFMPSVEITERVWNITDKIFQIYVRRIKKSFDPRIVTIAAGFVAWQSCHYYDKNHNSQVSFIELREPTEDSDFQKYLTLTHLEIDDHNAGSISRNVKSILKQLLELFNCMTWIQKRRKCKKDIPKYLELILQFKGMTADALNEKEEIERLNQPIITPIIPRELTAEEEAILDAPELTEKDLTYAEAEYYVRSDLEVRRTDKHLSFTKTLDSELMEMERKRQKKKRLAKSKLNSFS